VKTFRVYGPSTTLFAIQDILRTTFRLLRRLPIGRLPTITVDPILIIVVRSLRSIELHLRTIASNFTLKKLSRSILACTHGNRILPFSDPRDADSPARIIVAVHSITRGVPRTTPRLMIGRAKRCETQIWRQHHVLGSKYAHMETWLWPRR
jgi:hypothetical protein